MRFTPDNFLYEIKTLVTGNNNNTLGATGNGTTNFTAKSADGGIKVDHPLPFADLTSSTLYPAITNNTAGTATTTWAALTGTYATDVAEFRNILTQLATTLNNLNAAYATYRDSGTVQVFSVPAGASTNIGTISYVIPRDYDEAGDTFILRVIAELQNADASISLSGTAAWQLPGSSTYGSTTAPVVATIPFQTSTGYLTNTGTTALEISFSGNGLLRDTAVTVNLSVDGSTSGNVYIYGLEVTTDSTIVSYNETDLTNNPSNPTLINTIQTGFGNPLR